MYSTKNERNKESIDSQIRHLRDFLNSYHPETNIHNYDVDSSYISNFTTLGKQLSFSVDRKLKLEELEKFEKLEIKKITKTEGQSGGGNNDVVNEKILNFQWAGEGNAYSNRLVCVTNKGKALVFNTDNGNCIQSANIGSGILNACAIEQTENQMLAVGGFDGAINLKTIVVGDNRRDNDSGTKKFTGHQGSVSAIRFMNTAFMISASLDSVLLLWDINSQGKIVSSYREHTSEVSGLDVNEVNGNIFATGSGDTTVKIWDIREKKACVATFQGSDSSINCVKFLPGRISTLAAGSEDSTIRLYDLRAVRELGNFKKKDDTKSVNSIGFSKSGMILFASSTDDNKILFWNIFDKEDFPFYNYQYLGGKESSILKASINSDKTKIAFIDFDEVVIIK